MKLLLTLTVLFWALTFIAWRWADRPGDDFGRAAVVLLVLGISLCLSAYSVGFAVVTALR